MSVQILINEGLTMIANVENPQHKTHSTVVYCNEAYLKLYQAGEQVHKQTPALLDMIEFVQRTVPEKYHGVINHAWSGIGDWIA